MKKRQNKKVEKVGKTKHKKQQKNETNMRLRNRNSKRK